MKALAFKFAFAPLLALQAVGTRRRVPAMPEAAGPREGQLGSGPSALRVLIAGDSSAAGVGVATQEHAFLGHFIRALHRRSNRPLRWRLRAKSGLTTRQVHELLQAEPPLAGDIAVVLSGVNDVIGLIPPRRAIEHRTALADWLIASGRAKLVVFAPLPPIHQFPSLPQPLRRVMGDEARRHNDAMVRWVATRKDVFVAPLDLQLAPAAMARDGFHPGEPVYRASGELIARFVADRLMLLKRG